MKKRLVKSEYLGLGFSIKGGLRRRGATRPPACRSDFIREEGEREKAVVLLQRIEIERLYLPCARNLILWWLLGSFSLGRRPSRPP